MSNQNHIEVMPRMWDQTIAASQPCRDTQPPQTHEMQVTNEADSVSVSSANLAISAGVGWFTRIKEYLIPVVFILGLIIVIYVMWKYFTKYRKAKAKPHGNIAVITEQELRDDKPPHPEHLIATEDMTKYELESDNESDNGSEDGSEDGSDHSKSRFEAIEEVSNEDASDDTSNASDSSSDTDDDSDNEEKIDESDDEPDIAEIERMIEESNDTDMDIDPTVDDPFSLEDVHINEPKITKKQRKVKRVTL